MGTVLWFRSLYRLPLWVHVAVPDIWIADDRPKERLKVCYREQYMPKLSTIAPQPSTPQSSSHLPQKVNFTAQYKQQSCMEIEELEEFWKLPREDFENCDPVQWWAGRQAQFAGVSRFARDIFTIPGELTDNVCSIIL